MNKQTEALKMAIEALDDLELCDYATAHKAIKACKEALEQPAPDWTCDDVDVTNCDANTLEQFCRDNIRLAPFFAMLAGALKQPAQEPVAWMEEYQSCKVNGDERLCHSDKVFRLVQLLANQLSDCQSLCAKYAEKTVINGEQKIKEVRAIKEALEQPAQEYLTRAQQVIRANNSAQEHCVNLKMDKCEHKNICEHCTHPAPQPAQEPVAWIEYLWVENEDDGKLYPETRLYDYPSDDAQPLYTHPAPSCEPLTQEKYLELKNHATQWTSSLPMFIHLINKHFGIDDGLDWK